MEKRQRRLLPVAAGILFLAGVAGIFCMNSRINGTVYELDDTAQDGSYQLQAEQSAQPESLGEPIHVFVNGEPKADKTGRCSLMAGNPPENIWDLCVTVRLDESGEEVYRSKVLSPGEREAYVKLSPVPEPGRYRATAEFTVLDRESGEVSGTVDAGIIITVEG